MIEVARRNAESELVAQRVHPVDAWRKRELLVHLVSSGDWRQVLVFTRMKSGANRLAEHLCKAGIEATAIHGNKSQPARTRALAGFKNGTVRVLVATDIAARGLDIEELPHVVNFELPNVPEDYVHRIGRTGRAGSTGEALSLVRPRRSGAAGRHREAAHPAHRSPDRAGLRARSAAAASSAGRSASC
jgi:ATP-dependent RNA helicase RhlE